MGSAERALVNAQEPFVSERLERVFSRCFGRDYNTRLCGGADEPIYQPAAGDGEYSKLYYRQDYFASALHESAHWCIAGALRRREVDFGYWYAPEGRNAAQQLAFEAVERKPQALEWYFSKACNYRFQVSADNLELTNAGVHDVTVFAQAVLEQALSWQQEGLPARAEVFYRALCAEFGTCVPAGQLHFDMAALRCATAS
ncbi:Elongation factor P hydroxylase [Halioglobus japonicus]|nr:Elongation factor P hydroxylase [Halioglobus japonicus]